MYLTVDTEPSNRVSNITEFLFRMSRWWSRRRLESGARCPRIVREGDQHGLGHCLLSKCTMQTSIQTPLLASPLAGSAEELAILEGLVEIRFRYATQAQGVVESSVH